MGWESNLRGNYSSTNAAVAVTAVTAAAAASRRGPLQCTHGVIF
jgi:hypothetical protein